MCVCVCVSKLFGLTKDKVQKDAKNSIILCSTSFTWYVIANCFTAAKVRRINWMGKEKKKKKPQHSTQPASPQPPLQPHPQPLSEWRGEWIVLFAGDLLANGQGVYQVFTIYNKGDSKDMSLKEYVFHSFCLKNMLQHPSRSFVTMS